MCRSSLQKASRGSSGARGLGTFVNRSEKYFYRFPIFLKTIKVLNEIAAIFPGSNLLKIGRFLTSQRITFYQSKPCNVKRFLGVAMFMPDSKRVNKSCVLVHEHFWKRFVVKAHNGARSDTSGNKAIFNPVATFDSLLANETKANFYGDSHFETALAMSW